MIDIMHTIKVILKRNAPMESESMWLKCQSLIEQACTILRLTHIFFACRLNLVHTCSIEIRHFIQTDSNSLGAFQCCG